MKELKISPDIVHISLMIYVGLSAYSIAMLVTRYYVFSKLGEDQAGFFQAAIGISLALGAISGPMNTLFLTPKVNRAIPDSEKIMAANEFQSNIMLVLMIIVFPVIVFPKLTLLVLFSSKFIPAYKIIYLFIMWQSLYLIVNVYQQLLIGLDDVVFYSISTTLGFGLVILLSPYTD